MNKFAHIEKILKDDDTDDKVAPFIVIGNGSMVELLKELNLLLKLFSHDEDEIDIAKIKPKSGLSLFGYGTLIFKGISYAVIEAMYHKNSQNLSCSFALSTHNKTNVDKRRIGEIRDRFVLHAQASLN